MTEAPWSLDPLHVNALVTVQDIEEELGTLLEEHANEFPFENRERVIGKWISQEGIVGLDYIGWGRQLYTQTLTEGQQTFLSMAVTYAVCARALKRMIMNRSPEIEGLALSRALVYYRTEAIDIYDRLNFMLNSSKEFAHETHDHLPLPTADAGVDQTVTVGATVTLDGSSSSDLRGPIPTYVWTFVYNDTTVTLLDNPQTYTFSIVGDYLITLTVTDHYGYSGSDMMTLTVEA